jgi:hypothetical protein
VGIAISTVLGAVVIGKTEPLCGATLTKTLLFGED